MTQFNKYVFLSFYINRGEKFRTEYSRLGNMRSILSPSVNVMALTATATKSTRQTICASLGMKDPVVVSIPPDKGNVTL